MAAENVLKGVPKPFAVKSPQVSTVPCRPTFSLITKGLASRLIGFAGRALSGR
jgi:hypothetical protein